jgi:CheY-like chemotaxis protein
VGSRFVVELPVATTEPPVVPEVSVPAPRSPAGILVLVVDDVLSNRRLAEALLRQAGYSVWLAANGAAALEAMQHDLLPDVVLMDVYMPGMDGLATSRRIRALPGRAGQVPIIAVTADASADRMPAYLAAGMNGAVTKPIDMEELVGAILAFAPPPPLPFNQEDAASLPSETATPRT